MKRPNLASVSTHWLTAWAILLALYFGLHAVYGDGQRGTSFLIHAYAGLVVLGIGVVRLFLRAPLPWPAEEARPWRIAALAVSGAHWALYGMMLLAPLTGWIVASRMGCCRNVPGLPKVDLLAAGISDAGPVQAGVAYHVHVAVVWALLVLVTLHVVAALYHHLIARDTILVRMIPLPRPGKTRQSSTQPDINTKRPT